MKNKGWGRKKKRKEKKKEIDINFIELKIQDLREQNPPGRANPSGGATGNLRECFLQPEIPTVTGSSRTVSISLNFT